MSDVQRALPRYQCHKQVCALKIEAIEPLPNPDTTGQSAASSYGAIITPVNAGYAPFEVTAEFVNRHNPQAGGYYVVYDDGYKSFSPAQAFEDGYNPIPSDYRDRVRAERQELSERTSKLHAFILDNPAWRDLPDDEKARLQEQAELQGRLRDVLDARIAAF